MWMWSKVQVMELREAVDEAEDNQALNEIQAKVCVCPIQ